MKLKVCFLIIILIAICIIGYNVLSEDYKYPFEDGKHEGTWLVWPHDYGTVYDYYDIPLGSTSYKDDIEDVWIAMTKALHTGEIVHIVAYDENEKAHIQKILEDEEVDMQQIDFFIYETDDVWTRDTGPIFILDKNGRVVIANFKFDGWGEKQGHDRDNALPQAIADAYGFDIIQIPELVLEGGAVELDGSGTLLAAKSSVVSKNRNPDKSIEEVEAILSKYFGITNFIWIEGSLDEEITDAHIDGTARFINDHQIFICDKEQYKELYMCDDDKGDWAIFENAKNAKGEPYELIYLPLTKNTVTAYGQDFEYYGSYTNYYIGNNVVLVPQYNDPNDTVALEIIAKHYPDREIVGIDCNNLIYYGGMIHCVTQQQPISGKQ